MPNGNGATWASNGSKGNGLTWSKGVLAGVAFMGGFLVAAVGVGVAYGDVRAHLTSPVIHETPTQKEARIRSIIDREIQPQLVNIKLQLDRIEKKVEHK